MFLRQSLKTNYIKSILVRKNDYKYFHSTKILARFESNAPNRAISKTNDIDNALFKAK